MKNAKRLLCLLLCAAMALSLLAACGGQGEEPQPTASTTEVTTAPTTVPETTVPETTAAPTEPPMTHLAPNELEKRINQELLSQGVPYEMDIVHAYSYDYMLGILLPTDETCDIPEGLEIRMDFDINTNRITEIFLDFSCSNATPEPVTQEQQTLVLELGTAISNAYDPTCSDEALETMIQSLPIEPATEDVNKAIANEIFLKHDIFWGEISYKNTTGNTIHRIVNSFNDNVLTRMTYTVSSTAAQFSQAVSVTKDMSACITVGELETHLNEKFTELGLPLALTIEKDTYARGQFYSIISYTGEYADVETNKLIYNFKKLFHISLDATDLFKDSYIRSVDFSINPSFLEGFHTSGPEYIDPLTDIFTELAFTIAYALDDQVPDDILEQLSSATPYKTYEDTYNGVTTISNLRSDIFSGLFCGRDEHVLSNCTYPSTGYTFDVIGLQSEEFDPYIPHGDEVNEPQYLEHEFEFGGWSIGDDYISHYDDYSAREAMPISVNDFLRGTYAPIRVDVEWAGFGWYEFVFEDYETGLSGKLDTEHYVMYQFDDDTSLGEVNVCYNTDYETYFPAEYLSAGLDPEYALRVPIGISLMYDEEMTPEEAHQLFTEKMEPTDVWGDYQVTVYCPRDIMHILLSNPETGEHQFWLLEKSRFDELYGDLTAFLERIG